MNVASTAPLSSLFQPMQNQSQASDQFKAMGNALKSGGITAAQQIYASMQKNSSAMGQNLTSQNGPVGQDFAALGKALNAGDIAGARAAFDSLKIDFQSALQAAGTQAAPSLPTPAGLSIAPNSPVNPLGLMSAAQLSR